MNFKIREGIVDDYIDIRNLTREVHELHYNNRPDVYTNIDNPLPQEYFQEILKAEDTKLLVIENTENKELVAYSTIKTVTTSSIPILVQQKSIFIDSFCVKSDQRRCGIGELLFKFIVGYAKEENASSIQLVVWEFNRDAIEFYEAMGMSTRNRRMEIKL